MNQSINELNLLQGRDEGILQTDFYLKNMPFSPDILFSSGEAQAGSCGAGGASGGMMMVVVGRWV